MRGQIGAEGWSKMWTTGFTDHQIESLVEKKRIDKLKFIIIGDLLRASRFEKMDSLAESR